MFSLPSLSLKFILLLKARLLFVYKKQNFKIKIFFGLNSPQRPYYIYKPASNNLMIKEATFMWQFACNLRGYLLRNSRFVSLELCSVFNCFVSNWPQHAELFSNTNHVLFIHISGPNNWQHWHIIGIYVLKKWVKSKVCICNFGDIAQYGGQTVILS